MSYNKTTTIPVDKSAILDELQKAIYLLSDSMKDASDLLVSGTNQPLVSYNRKKREIKKILESVGNKLSETLSEKDKIFVKGLDDTQPL